MMRWIIGILSLFLLPGAGSWGMAVVENEIEICTTPAQQAFVKIVSDGNDGAILVWQDKRNQNMDIYAQHLSGKKTILWKKDGIPVCWEEHRQEYPLMVTDGHGGAIILWQDKREGNNNLYLQRMTGEGRLLWEPQGIRVSKVSNYLTYPQLSEDGYGGCLVLWEDKVQGKNTLLIQRINANGKPLWKEGGIVFAERSEEASGLPKLIPTPEGGAIVAWQNMETNNNGLYIQKFDKDGKTIWPKVKISTLVNWLVNPELTSDGEGGAIVVWEDSTNYYYGIFAQRINPQGKLLWNSKGVLVSSNPDQFFAPQIVSDNHGGGIVLWQYEDKFQIHNILYTQRLSKDGKLLWDNQGVPICHLKTNISNPQLTSDNKGNYWAVWQDSRNNNTDIYIQSFNEDGKVLLEPNGHMVCNINGAQIYPQMIVLPKGGAIVSWWDLRSRLNYDIYAKFIDINQNDGNK